MHYLVHLIRDILEHLEKNGAYIDCIIVHFVKAFDLFNLTVALSRATSFNARQIVLQMIGSFFKNQKQNVQLPNGEVFDLRELTCGSSQGSKLGPLDFLKVINKLRSETTERYKFAHDLFTLLPRLLS